MSVLFSLPWFERTDAAQMTQRKIEVLAEGKHLRLVREGRWEFVTRTKPVGAAFIGAITQDGCFLITDEYRIPLAASVIGCPAGLIGDLQDQANENVIEAVKRELIEEAGYEAGHVEVLTRGPTSAGQIDEVMTIVLATNLKKVGTGGGVGDEQIAVHEVPLTEIHDWLDAKHKQGRWIDPKVYTVLYFVLAKMRGLAG